jgi:hypothetical protein
MEINEYIVEQLVDPTGLIQGDRYEFRLFITLDEDDDLYSESGIGVRAIFAVDEQGERVVVAHFFERETDAYIDFELDEDELLEIEKFCKQHYNSNE